MGNASLVNTEPVSESRHQSAERKSLSRETLRRLGIVAMTYGTDWHRRYPGTSVSSLYRKAIGDNRDVIYVRVSPEVKTMLREISEDWDTDLSEAIELLVRDQFESEDVFVLCDT